MLDQTVFIQNATAKATYEVLLSSDKHALLTGDDADIDSKVGGKFKTFGGYSDGENLELIPNKLIKQKMSTATASTSMDEKH